jgi:hypothetical protein
VRDREFLPMRHEDTFEVGRFEGDTFSGVYLTPAYMDRLREVLYAVTLQVDAAADAPVADAVRNLVGILKRLTQIHAEQLKLEGYPWSDADRAAAEGAKKELDRALEALKRFPPSGDNPDDA